MPIRAYECRRCGRKVDEIYDGKYPKTIACECGARMDNVLGGVTFRLAFNDGFDMGAGRSFYSQRERDEWLVKTNKRRRKD